MSKDDARLLLPEKTRAQLSRDFPSDVESIQLFRAIRFLAQRIDEMQTERLAPYRVSAKKYNYLAVLYVNRRKGLSAGQLGALVRTTSGSVTTMTNSLESEGLLERDSHPTDGRSVVLRLTRKGSELYRKSARTEHAYLAAAVKKLGPGRSQRLLKLLVETGNTLQAVRPKDE